MLFPCNKPVHRFTDKLINVLGHITHHHSIYLRLHRILIYTTIQLIDWQNGKAGYSYVENKRTCTRAIEKYNHSEATHESVPISGWKRQEIIHDKQTRNQHINKAPIIAMHMQHLAIVGTSLLILPSSFLACSSPMILVLNSASFHGT